MACALRLVLSLILISTSVPVRANQDGASAPTPALSLGVGGKTLDLTVDDQNGKPVHAIGAWATLTDSQLHESVVLDGLKNNDPRDPLPIFTLESRQAEAKKFREDLATEGVAADLVVVRDEDNDLVENAALETMAAENRSRPPLSGSPTVQEKTLGSIQAIFQGGVSSFVFSSVGIDPVQVVSIVLLRTLITANWSINTAATDRFFNRGLDVQNHPERARAVNLFRRFLVDISIGEVTRAISGSYGHVHSVLSFTGQAEIWKNVVVAVMTSYILLFTRLKTFPDEKDHYVVPIINFTTFFPAAVINLLDFTKTDLGPIKFSHVVMHLGSFDITVANLVLLGGYVTVSALIHFFRPQTLALAQSASRTLAKTVDKVTETWERLQNGILRCRGALDELQKGVR